MNRIRGRNTIQKLLCLTLILAMILALPNVPYVNDGLILHAAVGDDGDDGGGDRDAGLEGLTFSGIGGSDGTDITQPGAYISDNDEGVYIYINSKKRTNDVYYRTQGFNLHVERSDSMNPKGQSVCISIPLYGSEGMTVNPAPRIGSMPVYMYRNDVNGNSYSEQEFSQDGYVSVGQLYKINKSKLRTLLEQEGVSFKNNSGTARTVYFSGITTFHSSSGWTNLLYHDHSNVVNYMSNHGFSAVSISDMKDYFNIPFTLKASKDELIYIDLKEGKLLGYQDKNLQDASGNFFVSKKGPLTFDTAPNKKFTIIGSMNLPYGTFQENGSSSQYLASVLAPNLRAGLQYPDVAKLTAAKYREVNDNGNWTTDPGDSFLMKKPDEDNTITWHNKAQPSIGNSCYIFVAPLDAVEADNDVVMYDGLTGLPMKLDKINYTALVNQFLSTHKADPNAGTHYDMTQTKKYTAPLYYTFPATLLSKTYEPYDFSGGDFRLDAGLDVDLEETVRRVSSGGQVLKNGKYYADKKIQLQSYLEVEQVELYSGEIREIKVKLVHPKNSSGQEVMPLYRGEYLPTGIIPMLYYDGGTGKLIKKEQIPPITEVSAIDSFKLGDVMYYTKQMSYKVGVTAQQDINSTGIPVMTATDLNVTPGNHLSIPNTVVNAGNYIVRVECTRTKPPTDPDPDHPEFIIPSQHLTYNFNYSYNDIKAVVDHPAPPAQEKHTITLPDNCLGNDSNGNPRGCKGHECTITHEFIWGEHRYDWESKEGSILNPLNYVFADRGGLTKVAPMLATGGGDTVTSSLSLQFTSHRTDVDSVLPPFAKYMETQNAGSLSFLKNHTMVPLALEALTPNNKYNDAGGSTGVSISIRSGNVLQPHGQDYVWKTTHSLCDGKDKEIPLHQGNSFATNKTISGKVTAEPSIVGKPLPVAGDVSDREGTSVQPNNTYFQTNANAIGFYPTYKMFVNGMDAWVLGKQQRKLKAVNVAKIDVLNTTPIVDMNSTWSRDKVDTGKLVMKGGYAYSTQTNSPMQIRVTTFIVVPKEGFVENSSQVRNSLLSEHDKLVDELRKTTNYKILTNLPEAYNASYPSAWKINNPHKTGSDNVTKARLPQPNGINTSIVGDTSSVMSLQDLDNLYPGKVNNKTRLAAQLETNDWYVERFDGFEVVKQVTTLGATYTKTSAINFIRNGGNSYNDLAHAVGNIPAGMFGIELGMYTNNAKFMGSDIEVERLTPPKLFYVRGVAYDDRN